MQADPFYTKGWKAMFLRATRVQTPPDKVNDAIKNFEANVLKGFARHQATKVPC